MSNSNIVSLDDRRKKPVEVPADLPAISASSLPPTLQDFVYSMYQWADASGMDTTTVDFKYQAATITTLLQGMLLKNDN